MEILVMAKSYTSLRNALHLAHPQLAERQAKNARKREIQNIIFISISQKKRNELRPERYSQLQEELTSTENRIAFARQHYNDCSAVYNTARQKFPSNIVANMFGFQPQDYFELEAPAEREAPQVKF
ncbi:hypothetical protein LCGC14_3153850 [marine sediment metagenome]|uniref:LemA family protein n=1 Tax=marine sediment metagenome TaxID=412755 RepID=A0A0F8YHQ6_9ZZZZ